MALSVKVDSWDDTKWDDAVSPASIINTGDTFTVSTIDLNNRTVTFAPASTNYTANLVAKSWDNSSWDDSWSGLGTVAVSQTFTVLTLDFNNRIVWLSG